jgi:hypothetical protein
VLELALVAVVALVVALAAALAAAWKTGKRLAATRATLRRALLDLAHAHDAADVKGETVEDLAAELRRRGIFGDDRIDPDPRSVRRDPAGG